MIAVDTVERALLRLYLAEGTALRREDLKKAREVAALLDELARLGKRKLLVDAAAGHGYVGLLAAELLGGVEQLVLIERSKRCARRVQEAAQRLATPLAVEVRAREVGDREAWPAEPDLVVALHACGAAADEVIARAIEARARWLVVVPCCYARSVPFAPVAEAHARRLGVPEHAEVRRRLIEALVDAERALVLEAAGYEVEVVSFVAKAVTPHNLAFRARRVGEPVRMREAAGRLVCLKKESF